MGNASKVAKPVKPTIFERMDKIAAGWNDPHNVRLTKATLAEVRAYIDAKYAEYGDGCRNMYGRMGAMLDAIQGEVPDAMLYFGLENSEVLYVVTKWKFKDLLARTGPETPCNPAMVASFNTLDQTGHVQADECSVTTYQSHLENGANMPCGYNPDRITWRFFWD